jgi:hypothetical protein
METGIGPGSLEISLKMVAYLVEINRCYGSGERVQTQGMN